MILGYFDAPCDRCGGTGQYRHFGACFACDGHGSLLGAVVGSGGEFPSATFRQVSRKTGRILKQTLEMDATRLVAAKRFDCAMTNSGWWRKQTHTDPVGTRVRVYGITNVAEHIIEDAGYGELIDGEWGWSTAQAGGGYATEPFDALDFHLDVRATA